MIKYAQILVVSLIIISHYFLPLVGGLLIWLLIIAVGSLLLIVNIYDMKTNLSAAVYGEQPEEEKKQIRLEFKIFLFFLFLMALISASSSPPSIFLGWSYLICGISFARLYRLLIH